MKGTHNRYFETKDEIIETLTSVFTSMQKDPKQIQGYLAPYL